MFSPWYFQCWLCNMYCSKNKSGFLNNLSVKTEKESQCMTHDFNKKLKLKIYTIKLVPVSKSEPVNKKCCHQHNRQLANLIKSISTTLAWSYEISLAVTRYSNCSALLNIVKDGLNIRSVAACCIVDSQDTRWCHFPL